MRFLLGTVFAGLALLLFGCGSKESASPSKPAMAPPPVTVATARQEPVPIEINAIGNAQPYRAVQVKSMVDGQIIRVDFQQGDNVRAGQLLFQLDKRPFQAALDQAQGKLAQDEATAANNKALAARANALLKQGVLAAQDAQTTNAQAQASAAAVQADKAAVETAKVNLGYTDIRAPISGRAGAILVNVGNLVKANDTNPLTTINQIEPIYVSFNIPEADLASLRAKGTRQLKVTATPPNQQSPARGTLTFIDNTVDTATGTIRLMGTFPNRDQKLWPGEYLNVRLTLGVNPNAVVVPATAVQSGQQGKFVYVVQPDGTAVATPVNTSRNYQQLAVISSGLTAGKSVIVDGQQRVVPNAKVNVVRTVQTEPSPAAEVNGATPAGETE